MVVRSVALTMAERLADPILKIAGVVLLVLLVLILATNFRGVIAVGWAGLATIAVMTAASLAVGHFLGGPEPRNRNALAMACATRFPGLGLLIASVNYPNAKPLPVVVAYLLISNLIVLPYRHWRKTQHAQQQLALV